MAEGQLPHLSRLAAQGGFYRLETSHSPESPTSWASFATGSNAGKHNIFDFLVRDPKTYMPDLGIVKKEMPEFLFNYLPIKKPVITSIRGGTSFWVTAGQHGVRSSLLTVPITFPPEDVENGELLAGLPLPDIRGTIGTFYYFATDLSRYEEGNTEMGGILKRLVMDRGVAKTELVGPPNPVVKAQQRAILAKGPSVSDADKAALAELTAREDIRLPVTVHWNRPERRATIEIDGKSISLAENEWSKWVTLEFRVNFLVRLHGMVQLFLIRADTELQLYISPVNWRPDNPVVPISSPASFSSQINDRLGFFRTLGWAEATWPLNEDRLDEKAFMDDLYRAFDDRAQVVLHRLDARKWDLLVGVSESTDRVQHMMWRFIDKTHPMYNEADAAKYGSSILRVYRRVDQFVGEVLDHLPPDTQVLVMSDHGFHSFRHAVNLNTWLVNEGFLAIKGQRTAMKGMNEMFLGSGQFWENVDWSRTKAYAMGLGQVFINLKGREGDGAVDPSEYQGRGRRPGVPPDGVDRSPERRAHREQRLQARRDLQRPVPEGRARPPGGHGRRLSRVLADHARRVAAGRDRLSQHAQVERRSLRVRLQDDPGAPHLEPQARGGRIRASSTSARPCSSTSACPSRRRWTANPSSDADARDPPRVRPPRALLPVAEPGAEGLRGGRRGGRPGRGTRRGQPGPGRRHRRGDGQPGGGPYQGPSARGRRPRVARADPARRPPEARGGARSARGGVHRQRAGPAAHRARDRRHRDPDCHARTDRGVPAARPRGAHGPALQGGQRRLPPPAHERRRPSGDGPGVPVRVGPPGARPPPGGRASAHAGGPAQGAGGTGEPAEPGQPGAGGRRPRARRGGAGRRGPRGSHQPDRRQARSRRAVRGRAGSRAPAAAAHHRRRLAGPSWRGRTGARPAAAPVQGRARLAG